MDIEDIIDQIGRDKYANFSTRAWASALTTGHEISMGISYTNEEEIQKQADFDFAYDIEDIIWGLDISNKSKIDLVFQFYRSAPAYTFLHSLDLSLWSLTKQEREAFWFEMAMLLSDEDERLVNPARYVLWQGPFENPDQVCEAWHSLLANKLNQSGLKWLIQTSGPVPYHLKKELYDQLISDDYWHPYILSSLIDGVLDSFGKIDKAAAVVVLRQLNVPDRVDGLNALIRDLES